MFTSTLYMINQNKRHETKKNDWRIKITSYKAFHIKNSDVRRFNKRLSRIRIDVEHAFKMLKKRWKSLIELRFRIRDFKNYIFAVRWIIACVMLHNILLNIQNDWKKEKEWWTFDEENAHEKEMQHLNDQQLIERLNKRNHIKRMILKND
jgi:hypothetical protein